MGKINARRPLWKTILWITGASIIIYIALVCFLLLVPKLRSHVERVTFDSSQWKAHLVGRDPIKLKMVDDLLSKHQLIGMSVNNIEELLGKPPQTNHFKDYDYVYWLGLERSAFGIDSEWLAVKFEEGVVVRVKILRD